MSAPYHADFWVAVTTAAPVLMVAHAVVVQRFDSALTELLGLLGKRRLDPEIEAITRRADDVRIALEDLQPSAGSRPEEVAVLAERVRILDTDVDDLRDLIAVETRSAKTVDKVQRWMTRRAYLALAAVLLAVAAFTFGLVSLALERDYLAVPAFVGMDASVVAFLVELASGVSIRTELRRIDLSPPDVA